MLPPIQHLLDGIAPAVDLDASQISICDTPDEFYQLLLSMIRSATQRIFLSTLYIGKSEQELIHTIAEAMRANPSLKLSILTDMLRGTREAPNPSCASLLAPLVAEFGDRVDIRMYHTPNLTGLKKRLVPNRLNEGWGLQHMKLYGADDKIILTGANLSTDYFTNRQDRYHVFDSREITAYYFRLQQTISRFSFRILPSDAPAGYQAVWPDENAAPNPLRDPKAFVAHTNKALHGLVNPPPPTRPISRLEAGSASPNTRVYLVTQTSQLLDPDTSTELPALTAILSVLGRPEYNLSSWVFTAGYFNPDPSLTQRLLDTASSRGTVITAHPAANGFYKSKGVSGMLPDAYTHLARRFLRGVHCAGRNSAVSLREWRRGTVNQSDGWSYHAKGFWVTMPGDNDPSLTIVGSSNYTKRSYSLDLEAGAIIVTRDEGLKRRLGDEQRRLQDHTTLTSCDDLATTERRTGLNVRFAMWLVGALGGAL